MASTSAVKSIPVLARNKAGPASATDASVAGAIKGPSPEANDPGQPKRGRAMIMLKNGKTLAAARSEADDAVKVAKSQLQQANLAAKLALQSFNKASRDTAAAEKAHTRLAGKKGVAKGDVKVSENALKPGKAEVKLQQKALDIANKDAEKLKVAHAKAVEKRSAVELLPKKV